MFTLFRRRAVAPIVLGLVAMFASPSAAAAQAAPALAAPIGYTLPAHSAAQPAAKTLVASANPSPSLPAVLQPALPVQHPAQPPRSLEALVAAYVDYGDRDAQEECLAKAVYFEARSESLEGQLAVANVVLNRSRSGVYPTSICEVVTQPWQFSFIRQGRFPTPDRSSNAWREAAAVAAIARKNLMQVVPQNVLWYHADYVAPSWGRRLTRVTQIGAHIFYS
ncbi:MAG TPA: cell wall hydrolase [Allosphingosinicella sp.]|nr:cell wall hydrolase [Allosphingosinicella sp.]